MRRRAGGAGCGARACVSHTPVREASGHRPSQLRGAAHSRAGRGKDERGESPALGRAKSPLSDPGSTVPGTQNAAVERRKATRPAHGRARRKA